MPLPILWVYFLVPPLIGHNVSGFVTVLAALVLYEDTYLVGVVPPSRGTAPTFKLAMPMGCTGDIDCTTWRFRGAAVGIGPLVAGLDRSVVDDDRQR